MVEGTPLLRVHLVKNWIQGSNPCVSAKILVFMRVPKVLKDFVHHPIHQTDTAFPPRSICSSVVPVGKVMLDTVGVAWASFRGLFKSELVTPRSSLGHGPTAAVMQPSDAAE